MDAERRESILRWPGCRAMLIPPVKFNDAWKKVLFNQFHDLAAGSGIGVIYKDAQQDYDVVRWTAEDADSKALHTISERSEYQVPGERRRRARHAVELRWPGSERRILSRSMYRCRRSRRVGLRCSMRRGSRFPCRFSRTKPETNSYQLLVKAKDVPSLGYSVLHVVPGARPVPTDLKAQGYTLENSAVARHRRPEDWLHHESLRQEVEL